MNRIPDDSSSEAAAQGHRLHNQSAFSRSARYFAKRHDNEAFLGQEPLPLAQKRSKVDLFGQDHRKVMSRHNEEDGFLAACYCVLCLACHPV